MFHQAQRNMMRGGLYSSIRRSVANPRSPMLSMPQRDFRAAVVFHGCGVYDGTETTEAVALLVGLSRLGASYQVYAPDRD